MNKIEQAGDDSLAIILVNIDGEEIARAIIDAGDAAVASRFRWYLARRRNLRYAQAHDRSKGPNGMVTLHRLLIGGSAFVDHIDGDGLNCKRSNLRSATNAENRQNTPPTNEQGRSRFRGVGWHKNAWRARVMIGGKSKEIGRFKTEEEAAKAVSGYRITHLPYSREAAGL